MLTNLTISYPDFKISEVIEPDHFDTNNADIKNKVDAIIAVLNQLTDATTDGASGADKVSLTAIAPYTSTKLQAFLEEVIAKLKSTGGSAEIGTPSISGVTGTTVNAQLASLKSLLDGHATRLSTAEGKITSLETRATNVEGRATTLEGRATSLETRATNLENNKTDKTTTTTLTTRVGSLETGKTDVTTTSALDGRVGTLESGKADKSTTYTRTDIDSKLSAKTNLTGDHQGTWRGLTPGQASEAINGARLDVLEAQNAEQKTLANGANTLSSVQEAPLKVLSTKGKTDIVNMKGIFGVKNPTIEANGKREVVETTLHALNGVQDELFRDTDGKLKKRTRFKEMALDGSLGWGYITTDYTGFKRVAIQNFPSNVLYDNGGTSSHGHASSKYDGKILDSVGSTSSEADRLSLNTNGLFVSIADTDSGWGETYTPTADEIKAYFYGWRMYASGGSRDGLYSTGTKAWYPQSRTYDTWDASYNMTTIPPSTLANNKDTWQPYKLVYQLATERIEGVATSGQVVLEEGNNTVELKQGVIVKERANPFYNSGLSGYIISGTDASAKLKYLNKKILTVYKNGGTDSSVTITSRTSPDATHGTDYTLIPSSTFDPTATYYVTYEILPELTAKAELMQVEYASSLKSLVEANTRQVAEHERRLDGLTPIVNKLNENLTWINATLQSGWSNLDSERTLKYSKDTNGYVRVEGYVRGGTPANDYPITTLPVGYRPVGGLWQTAIAVSAGLALLRVSNSTGAITVETNSAWGATSVNPSSWTHVEASFYVGK